jgi:hypothetical protein
MSEWYCFLVPEMYLPLSPGLVLINDQSMVIFSHNILNSLTFMLVLSKIETVKSSPEINNLRLQLIDQPLMMDAETKSPKRGY